MNKRIVILFFILAYIFHNAVYAGDMEFKIADAEKNIINSAVVDIDYSDGMIIGSELLDAPVQTAIEKKREYENREEAKYKDLQADIVVNLKGASNKVNLSLDSALSDYAAFVDNIIINADGIYCFISLAEFSVKKSETNLISLSIEDEQNVTAKYNGTAQISFFKIVLLCLFVFIAVYMLFFVFIYVRKKQFKTGFNVKLVYGVGSVIAILSIVIGIVIFLTDGNDFAEREKLIFDENEISLFTVDLGDYSSKDIQGVSLGILPYNESFNVNILTACKKSTDNLETDKVIGGSYISSLGVFKFPVKNSGGYYLRNNSVSFNDVNTSDEGLYEAISILASKNILSGKADGVYGVDDTVTRAESVTMFCKMLDIDEKADSDGKFDDINTSDWFYNYVMSGKKYEILSGYDDNTFRAGNVITRQEFAAVLGQILENRFGYILPKDTSNLLKYEDSADISFWAVKYISLLERQGINIWEGVYLPKEPITRGEAAMMLYRAYCLIG